MLFFYYLSTRLYFTVVRIASLFNEKAAKMIVGRYNWREELSKKIDPKEKYIWVHCASLGEFEQGRPLIEKIKEENPKNYKVLLTFFSPSGYEVRKNYQYADVVCYLPFDTLRNASDFVNIVNPQMAVFVKYEIWYYILKKLNSEKIPTFLISGIFRKNQIFFKWYGKFYLKALSYFTHLFLQDDNSAEILKRANISNITVCGDTRADRVIGIASEKYSNQFLENFAKSKKTIVCGSTWPADEKIICEFINKCNDDYRFIIAPHEIGENHLVTLENLISKKSIRLSECEKDVDNPAVVIVDSIGILSKLYRFGQIAFIGGGFGKGIHNILEAAVYEIPVIFGPNYKKFREACDLINIKSAFEIHNVDEFESIIKDMYLEEKRYLSVKNATKYYISNSFGATQQIFDKMQLIEINNTI